MGCRCVRLQVRWRRDCRFNGLPSSRLTVKERFLKHNAKIKPPDHDSLWAIGLNARLGLTGVASMN